MKSITANLDNAVPHVLYDLSIPLPERKEKALHFKCLKDAANFIGMPYNQLYAYRVPGKRVKAKDGKLYAVRIKKMTKD